MKNKKLLTGALIGLLLLAGLVMWYRRPVTVETRQLYGMGTVIHLTVYGGTQEDLDGAAQLIGRIESDFSTVIEGSLVYRLNAAAGSGSWTALTPQEEKVLTEALLWAKWTDGAFDPALGPVVQLWGIGTDRPRVPSEKELSAAVGLSGWRRLQMEPGKARLSRVGEALELGGIVKGYAADELRRFFEEKGISGGVIDLGGNVLTFGKKPDGSAWRIGVQDPGLGRGKPLGVLTLNRNVSVVTSGVYERFFTENGVTYHHIFDPATGYPVATDLSSVTVLSDRSIDGDALSTALFVLGQERAMKLVESLPGVDALFVRGKQVALSSGLAGLFKLTGDYTIETR